MAFAGVDEVRGNRLAHIARFQHIAGAHKSTKSIVLFLITELL